PQPLPSMSDQLTLVNVDAPWRRALLLVPVALTLAAVWAAGRWFIGNTLANYPPNEQFARAAERLAPSYVMPRWYLGNLLLRAGRDEEAVVELRGAAESDPTLRGPIFASVWSIFDGDVARVTAAIGGSPAVRGELVKYLITQKRTDDALKLWAALSPQDRRAQRAAGDALVEALLAAKRVNSALSIYREASPDGARVATGQITNGGFEDEAVAAGKKAFDWSVTPVPQAQTGIDPGARHSGARSLRVSFNAPSSIQYANVTQLVAVEPGARYRLEFFVRTDGLKSVASLVVDVVSAKTGGAAIATSAPAPAGTNDWQPIALEFTAPQDADGVVLLIRRQPCRDEACPIFGKIWYDDFSLQRAGAEQQRGAARSAAAAGDSAGDAARRQPVR
ncbi:MAG: carbohydrate binding domain-containing protein, partial [Acidobacteria bacterium]|nr:carbohydrate binding domain-containing protein [Acidobacteriota bacterium]